MASSSRSIDDLGDKWEEFHIEDEEGGVLFDESEVLNDDIDTQWCLVEKFCHKLFEESMEAIVKPYGMFMKAPDRRNNKQIGAGWLRDNMAHPLVKNSDDMTEMSNQSKNVHDTRISDAVMDNGENYGSGIKDLVLRNDKGGKGVIIGETVGKIGNLNSSAGLVIFENKRRRTEEEFLLGQSDSNMGHNKLLMDTNMETVNKEGNYVMDHDLGRTEEILEEENRSKNGFVAALHVFDLSVIYIYIIQTGNWTG
ncbi:hypothetical protein POM88_032080 [Heracleum sosnowskyi]|uniref:Uncharacterized protein n=1 Tax=Heracleum sosnowskyi TaxID=360622 RepID=A0AAD8MK80_9APIA|nr:hypothetical protein POM88_032080 [Heracleum sosnowskyi]